MKKILTDLENMGILARAVKPEHLSELKQDMGNLLAADAVLNQTIGRYIGKFEYDLKDKSFQAKSILVVAVPDKISRIYFNHKGKKKVVYLPPQYLFNTSVELEKTQPLIMEVNRKIKDALGAGGFKVEKINLPCKLMAARSGLSKYGRNNIAYINGESSFYWIGIYLTDMPVEVDTWQGVETMEHCKTCSLCAENCPTCAIPSDRYLLHAEKCLTFHNENTDEFPNWIKKSDHNAIIGCLKCQVVCPMNKSRLEDMREGEEFTEEETELILATNVLAELPEYLQKKLEHDNLAGDYEFIPRNLKVLL